MLYRSLMRENSLVRTNPYIEPMALRQYSGVSRTQFTKHFTMLNIIPFLAWVDLIMSFEPHIYYISQSVWSNNTHRKRISANWESCNSRITDSHCSSVFFVVNPHQRKKIIKKFRSWHTSFILVSTNSQFIQLLTNINNRYQMTNRDGFGGSFTSSWVLC